jgi:hypothetical protein
METVLTGLIVITLLILAVLLLSQAYFSSQDAMFASWRDMQERLGAQSRTNLVPVDARTLPGGSTDTIEITLKDSGNTKWATDDFGRWDVILQYVAADGSQHTAWYPYGSGTNTWTNHNITELYEPNILNPGEELVIWVTISPTVQLASTNTATIATPNGISATAVFTR